MVLTIIVQTAVQGAKAMIKENHKFMENICCETSYKKAVKTQKKKAVKKK